MKERAPIAYRLLLRLFPASFRTRARPELDEVAAAAMRTARQGGARARLRAWLSLMADGLRGLVEAWWAEWARNRTSRQRGDGMFTTLLTELLRTARRLRRSPGYAVAAIATLAVGLGATAAIWTVVDAALLRPLPYDEADRLAVISSTRDGSGISVAYPDLLDWRERTRQFEDIAGFAAQSYNLTGEGEASRVSALMVTSNLFAILGTEPFRGRVFEAAEDAPGAARVAVIAHGFWQSRLGGDPAVVGRTILLNDESFTVIGVMPAGFAFPDGIVFGASDVWVPAGLAPDDWSSRSSHPGIVAIGKLRDGVALESARDELVGIAAQLEAEHPDTNARESVGVGSALDVMVGSLRPALRLLLGAVVFVLLIACANVANLTLVRATARRRETAVRAMLGASRGRLALDVILESIVLALAGGLIGVFFAQLLLAGAAGLVEGLPRLDNLALDVRAVLFTGGLALLTALVFGLVPALRLAADDAGRLRAEAVGTRVTRGRLRGAFVIAQVALALVLLVGAGVLVRSFAAMQEERGGIRPEGVVTFTLRLPAARYDGVPAGLFYERLESELAALPGVRAVGSISTLPFSGFGSQSGMRPAGAPEDVAVRTDVNVVTPGYFAAMGVELVAGRAFTGADHQTSASVVVVDETFAARFWPGTSALGQRVTGWGLEDAEVIGVARHVKNYGVTRSSREELYMPHAQRPYLRMSVQVRAADPAAVFGRIRATVAALDADLPVDGMQRMTNVVASTVATPRLAAFLSAAFASLATLLAIVGLYGVIAYGVGLRTQEFSTRMALGARAAQVQRMVAAQAARLAAGGIVFGLGGAYLLSRFLEGMVFGVSARDPLAYLGLPPLLLGVALLAGTIPARRAARVSPMQALRDE